MTRSRSLLIVLSFPTLRVHIPTPEDVGSLESHGFPRIAGPAETTLTDSLDPWSMRRAEAGDEERRRSAQRIIVHPSKRSHQRLGFNERSASITLSFFRESRATTPSTPSRRNMGLDRRRLRIVVGSRGLVDPSTCWHPGSRDPRALYENLRRAHLAPTLANTKKHTQHRSSTAGGGGGQRVWTWDGGVDSSSLTSSWVDLVAHPGRRSSGASSSLLP